MLGKDRGFFPTNFQMILSIIFSLQSLCRALLLKLDMSIYVMLYSVFLSCLLVLYIITNPLSDGNQSFKENVLK